MLELNGWDFTFDTKLVDGCLGKSNANFGNVNVACYYNVSVLCSCYSMLAAITYSQFFLLYFLRLLGPKPSWCCCYYHCCKFWYLLLWLSVTFKLLYPNFSLWVWLTVSCKICSQNSDTRIVLQKRENFIYF